MQKRLMDIRDRVVSAGRAIYRDIPDSELLSLINTLDPITHSMGMAKEFTDDIIVQFLIEFTEIGVCARQAAETLNKILKRL